MTKPESATGTMSAGGSAALATITSTQPASIDRALSTPLQHVRLAADRTAAARVIRTMLTTGSCASIGAAFRTLTHRMLEPAIADPYLDAAMPKMRYHDRSTCLDLVRVTGWCKPALNAIAFAGWYAAPDSGEAASHGFAAQKSGDGESLIRSIMPTAN